MSSPTMPIRSHTEMPPAARARATGAPVSCKTSSAPKITNAIAPMTIAPKIKRLAHTLPLTLPVAMRPLEAVLSQNIYTLCVYTDIVFLCVCFRGLIGATAWRTHHPRQGQFPSESRSHPKPGTQISGQPPPRSPCAARSSPPLAPCAPLR